MAFIVVMWWGRPHEIQVQAMDEHGGLYVKEVIPNGPPDPERRTFSCSAWNWEAAQDLGRAFGWRPKGPLFEPWSPKGAAPERQAAYVPDGWILACTALRRTMRGHGERGWRGAPGPWRRSASRCCGSGSPRWCATG